MRSTLLRRCTQLSAFLLFVCIAGCRRTEPPPTVEPKDKQAQQDDRRNSYSLQRPQIEWSDHANVRVHFLQPHRTPDEKPFFVVWTDARLYSGDADYPSAMNNPPRKYLVNGNRNLRWGGKDNGFDREVKYSFEIDLSEKGVLTIEGKTYDFAKGALFLISGQDGDVRVKQLSRDASKLPSDENAVIAYGKADADIKAFFSKSARDAEKLADEVAKQFIPMDGNAVPFTFRVRGNNVSLSIRKLTLVFEGIGTKADPQSREIVKDGFAIPLPGAKITGGDRVYHIGGATVKVTESWDNGVNSITVNAYSFRILDKGMKLTIGDQTFALDTEQTVVISKEGSAKKGKP